MYGAIDFDDGPARRGVCPGFAESRGDSQVLLFYKVEEARRWVCAVARQAQVQGFLVTAYPTDAIKEGVRVWPS